MGFYSLTLSLLLFTQMVFILLCFVTFTVVLVQLRVVAFVRGYLGKRCLRRLQLWGRQKTWFNEARIYVWEQASICGRGKGEKIDSGSGEKQGRSPAFPLFHYFFSRRLLANFSPFSGPKRRACSHALVYGGNTSIPTDVFWVSVKTLKDKSTLTNSLDYS